MKAFPVPLTKALVKTIADGLRIYAPHLGRSDAERSIACGFGYESYVELREAIDEFPETRRFVPRRFAAVAMSTGAMASGTPEAGARSVTYALARLAAFDLGERDPVVPSAQALDDMARSLRLVANMPRMAGSEKPCSPYAIACFATMMDTRQPRVTEGSVLLAAASLGFISHGPSSPGPVIGVSRNLLVEQSRDACGPMDIDRDMNTYGFAGALPWAIKASGMLPDEVCERTCMPFSALYAAIRGDLDVPDEVADLVVDVLTRRKEECDVRSAFPDHMPEWFDHVREYLAA